MNCNIRFSSITLLAAILILIFPSCTSREGQSAKFEQYYVQGQQLYLQHCSNCHQPDGTGLGLLFPPLNKSDFMDQYPDQVICMIKNGETGELIVNGKTFNHEMPGIATLTDLEIAEIATYIYNSWGRQHELFEAKEVNSTLAACNE